jgi:hypothetical protein
MGHSYSPASIWSGGSSVLSVNGLNGNDDIEVIGDVWAKIGLGGGKGNDRIFLNAVTERGQISSGLGSDVVEIRDSQIRYFDVSTGLQNDRVTIGGTNSFHILDLFLGGGADVLEGDATPGAGLLPLSPASGGDPQLILNLFGGHGTDILSNAAYFRPDDAVISILEFEVSS